MNIHIHLCLAFYELSTGNRQVREAGETFNDLNITTLYNISFHVKTNRVIAFTSILNLTLRFGENLRHVLFKAGKVTLKVLALPTFLKLFTNLKRGDSTGTNAPDVSLPADILSLSEYETVDRVREPSNPH
jgi:hypothetical protein